MADDDTTTDDTTDAQDDTTDAPTEDLGDAGKRALAAERQRASQAERASKTAARQLKQVTAELELLRQAGASDSEKAIAQAKKEAATEARKEALAEANGRLVRAEVRTAAAAEKIDPALAVKLLDLDDFDVDDDGEIDTKAITKAVKALIEEHPYLTGEGDGRVRGSADGGSRRTATPADDMNTLMRRAIGRE